MQPAQHWESGFKRTVHPRWQTNSNQMHWQRKYTGVDWGEQLNRQWSWCGQPHMFPHQSDIFRTNHFVVLYYRHRKQTQHHIDLTSTPAASGPPPAQSDRPLTPTSDRPATHPNIRQTGHSPQHPTDAQQVINAEGGYDAPNKHRFLDLAYLF